jgi:F-type H+-transporting ATPase subunit epsilon
MVPTQVVVNALVKRVVVDTTRGSHGFLPRHIDFAAALVPGVLSYVDGDDQLGFVAVDGGVLVKKGAELLVSTPDAAHARALGELGSFIKAKARRRQELERTNRALLAWLEVALVRRLIEMGGG